MDPDESVSSKRSMTSTSYVSRSSCRDPQLSFVGQLSDQ